MIKNTACYSRVPITVQAGLRVRKLALHSNRSYGYAFRSRAALSNTSPPVSPGGEMITQRFGSTKDFAKKWNNRVYFRLSKMLCGFKDQVRARPSGETGGLHPAPASRDPGEKCGLSFFGTGYFAFSSFCIFSDPDITISYTDQHNQLIIRTFQP